MESFLARAADEFGEDGHVFRPNRDVRFSRDKRPYKDHCGAVVNWRSGTAAPVHYVQVGADGLLTASGYHELSRDQLARFRRAVDDARSGGALIRAVRAVRAAGLSVDGSELARAPRGYPADHPRIELLHHRRLTVSRRWRVEGWMHTPEAYEQVVAVWRAAGPVTRWLERHVGAPLDLSR
jgi:uncharacterized protein (TIGR02453 family)